MKTVRNFLLELDEQKLMDCFYEQYYFEIAKNDDDYSNKTIKQIKNQSDKYVRELINHLKTLPLKELNYKETGVFFVYGDKYDSNFPMFGLTYIKDLINNGVESQLYAYETRRQEEVLNYFVPETNYTKDYVYQLFASILWELSFFGIKQEKLDSFLKEFDERLLESEKEINEIYNNSKKLEDINKLSEIKNLAYVGLINSEDLIRDFMHKVRENYKNIELSNIIKILQNEEIIKLNTTNK